ncbi:MAG: hypothetical protein J4O06_15115, partial [Chloroflexi bacterium]|nr:hypothetical protein [Chloroflexota bacterium]
AEYKQAAAVGEAFGVVLGHRPVGYGHSHGWPPKWLAWRISTAVRRPDYSQGISSSRTTVAPMAEAG